MSVVVLINGREAIPVRAIPYMADSTVSADILVKGLLCSDNSNALYRNRVTIVALAAMEEGADAIARKVVDMAIAGDMSAARLVLEPLVPPAKERPIFLALPSTETTDGIAEAQQAILHAVAAGDLLPGEGATMAGIVEARRKAVETLELEQRITALEANQ